MNEQLPLKRIFIGLVATMTAAVAVPSAGTVNETVHGDKSCRSYVYAKEISDYQTGAQATVIALNHEENTAVAHDVQTQNTALPAAADEAEEGTEEYIVEEWWKAEVSDYSEALEQEGYVTIETAQPETASEEIQAAALPSEEAAQPAQVQTPQQSDGPVSIESSSPGEYIPGSVQSVSWEGCDAPGYFYFVAYGWGHGVGMSQNGANYYATYAGDDYTALLQRYYPGTELVQVPGAESETISVGWNSGSVLDIVSRVCEAEVGPSFNEEAIKAQAVAVYSYIKYNGGSVRSGAVAISASASQKVRDNVSAVLGQALYYNGAPALTQFYASSGGTTASCKDIFYQDIPYLRSVECSIDAERDKYYGLHTNLTVDQVRYRIQNNFGVYLSSDYSNWIQPVEGDGGYVAKVNIDGQKTVNGYDFARALGLKSAKFAFRFS